MLKDLNDAIDFIEKHLMDDISVQDVAEYVGESDFHFRKIFQAIAGISLSHYIKQRKLSMANHELLQGESVTDVAFKYGYESVEGFSRAFKNWSSYLPSEVRKTNTILSFPKLSFYINVQGGNTMEAKIVTLPAFRFAGVQKRVPMQFEGVNQAIVELTESITDEQMEEMHRLQNMDPKEIVNVSYDADGKFIKEEGDLTHMIGVLTTMEGVNDNLDTIAVPAHTWVVFPNEGPFPSTLQNTMARTASEWLPSSNYELVHLPSFSLTIMDSEKEDYAYSEIWLPVRRKPE
ncbi:AraC family transcriptional regulator [Virgibacillus sp. NKC19-16]|uniref:AraC family transcriptional regulator n=1 Tax=Virgibacillus salidurans TaxID=2831673 RepID=UPI001F3863EA|nr:AraC family transcriptional regulator [Virgibacillus sp. NKC19-16]UJL45871.1 AraC family transcriptional regulator [Virgibacillus sp. NKC19-16]